MNTPELQKLINTTTQFRKLIEEKKNILAAKSPKFEYFPKNCCGVTSNLLALYLEKYSFSGFIIVNGEKDGLPHSWLQKDTLIIDITADQFKDCDEEIIVTTDDRWHKTFTQRESHLPYRNKFTPLLNLLITK